MKNKQARVAGLRRAKGRQAVIDAGKHPLSEQGFLEMRQKNCKEMGNHEQRLEQSLNKTYLQNEGPKRGHKEMTEVDDGLDVGTSREGTPVRAAT